MNISCTMKIRQSVGPSVTPYKVLNSNKSLPFLYSLLFILLTFTFSLPPSSFASDATSFDPTSVEVKATSPGGIPIGSWIPWGTTAIPDGFLECNGQAFDPAIYPHLYAALGNKTNVPDLRGKFLRGWDNGRGVDAGRALLSEQGDAIRNISGSLMNTGNEHLFSAETREINCNGALYVTTSKQSAFGGHWTTNAGTADIQLDASRVVPTADENRPQNVAVIYIIKAK